MGICIRRHPPNSRTDNGFGIARLILAESKKTGQRAIGRLAGLRSVAKLFIDNVKLAPEIRYVRATEFLRVKEDEFMPHAILGYLMLFNSASLEEAGLPTSLKDAGVHILRATQLAQTAEEHDQARYLLGSYSLKAGISTDEEQGAGAAGLFDVSAKLLTAVSGNKTTFAAACYDAAIKDPGTK